MGRTCGRAGNGQKEGTGELEIAPGQHLLKVYPILGLCKHRLFCFLKPTAFENWGN